jgi:hypothetical protein
MVRKETSGAVDDSGDARGNGLMDLKGRGIAMVRRAGRELLAMVPFGGLAVSMRDFVCVRVHGSSTLASYTPASIISTSGTSHRVCVIKTKDMGFMIVDPDDDGGL